MTELVDLLMKGGPWTVAAAAIIGLIVVYRDGKARDAKIFDLFERSVRRQPGGDDKEGT